MRPARTPFGFWLAGHPAMQDGTFEPEETRLLLELLRRADRFIDVGANAGYYVCLSKSLGKPAVAFEPVPSNVRLLMRNLDVNGYTDVELWPVGLSDHQGLLAIYGGATGASLVEGWSGTSSAYRQTIPVTTLDTVLHGRFEREQLVIKIDVEGAEYDVLKGAAATASRTPRPIWLVEINYNQHWPEANKHFVPTFDFFWSKGYTAHLPTDDRRLVTREEVLAWAARPDSQLPSYNWLFR